MTDCKECGMPVEDGEYHPYAACLMFKGCHNSDVVQANLDAVVAHGIQCEVERHSKGMRAGEKFIEGRGK